MEMAEKNGLARLAWAAAGGRAGNEKYAQNNLPYLSADFLLSFV